MHMILIFKFYTQAAYSYRNWLEAIIIAYPHADFIGV